MDDVVGSACYTMLQMPKISLLADLLKMLEEKMNTEEKIRKIIAEVLSVDEDTIDEETTIGDIPEWDSLSHIQIISAIEKEFGFNFTPDVMMDLEDVSDIIAAVKERVR